MFIITGGGSGIGAALAKVLASHGKDVLIVGRREYNLIQIAETSSKITYFCTDIATSSGRNALVSHLKSQERLSGLIHNAGTIEPIAPIAAIKEDDWNKIIATNLNAPLFLTQALLEKLKGGRVLNIGSGVAYFPVQAWAPYCVSKAALSMLTRAFQLEIKNPYFASVMPGIIDSPMQDFVRQSEFMDKEKLAFFQGLKAKDGLVSTETVALFLAWLLLNLDNETYCSKEWDIYDTSHHKAWLPSNHQVPPLE